MSAFYIFFKKKNFFFYIFVVETEISLQSYKYFTIVKRSFKNSFSSADQCRKSTLLYLVCYNRIALNLLSVFFCLRFTVKAEQMQAINQLINGTEVSP